MLQKKEDGELLLDKIRDQAEQKGTGSWSVAAALQLGVPYSPLAEAVTARLISSLKSEREKLSAIHSRFKKPESFHLDISSVKNSYDFI